VHYILLGMADALCEAKCVDQGISAKCISCFGHNGVSQEEGEVDVLTFFIYMYVLICIEMSMLVHMYLYISGCRGIHVSRCRLLSRCGLGGIETPDVGFRFRQGSSARSACAESLVGCDEGFSRAFSAR
jgi:hypothetical protein